MQDDDIAEVYSAADEAEAYLVKNLLDNQGIQARVVNDTLYGVAGGVPCGLTVEPRVWVKKLDSDRALHMIEQWQIEQQSCSDAPKRSWTCPHCGQKVPGQFDVCWNCESPRDASVC